MNILVQYTTQLRAAIGVSEEWIELPNDASLSVLLTALASQHAEPFQQLVLDENGRLRPNMICCVNDQQALETDSATLPDGATVTLLSAISGG